MTWIWYSLFQLITKLIIFLRCCYFLCLAPPQGSAPRLLEPPSDYRNLPEQGYYKFHLGPVTRMVARLRCEEEGTQLAIINGPREVLALTSLWVKKLGDWRDDWAYIGIHDLFEEGQFVTISSKFLSTLPTSKLPQIWWLGI